MDKSDYLSLSIENLGKDTRISVSTVEENPVTYSSTLSGVSFADLQYMVDGNIDSVCEYKVIATCTDIILDK